MWNVGKRLTRMVHTSASRCHLPQCEHVHWGLACAERQCASAHYRHRHKICLQTELKAGISKVHRLPPITICQLNVLWHMRYPAFLTAQAVSMHMLHPSSSDASSPVGGCCHQPAGHTGSAGPGGKPCPSWNQQPAVQHASCPLHGHRADAEFSTEHLHAHICAR